MLQLGWVIHGRILELKLGWAIAHVCMVETGLATQHWSGKSDGYVLYS